MKTQNNNKKIKAEERLRLRSLYCFQPVLSFQFFKILKMCLLFYLKNAFFENKKFFIKKTQVLSVFNQN